MATEIKVCRVCGNRYEACHSLRPTGNTFIWQEVACSPECGAKYLADIRASRGIATPGDTAKIATPVESTVKTEETQAQRGESETLKLTKKTAKKSTKRK